MRIAIVASGRFHVCDLARELAARGHDVAFFSLVPPWRTARFGLPLRCNRWILPALAPLYAASIRASGARRQELDGLLVQAIDELVSRVIGRCDVFIGMSMMSLRTMEVVRRKYGAKCLVERGSRHILSQRDILEALPRPEGAPPPVPRWAIERSLAEYEIADRVVVPAMHVVRSFVERGFPEERLLRNPYGVDLGMFPATEAPGGSSVTAMVGTWCLRKGCDTLVDAFRTLRRGRLLHVGAVADAPVPTDIDFEARGPVDQRELHREYARAHAFALPSREEGLALVIPQALSCGVPVVCSDRSGGEDVAALLEDPRSVTVIPPDDPQTLARALDATLDFGHSLRGRRDLMKNAREQLSWSAYGARYDAALRAL